jgi:hypothetical protein
MLRFGAHPSEWPQWKTANCVVIPKSGKANYKSPSSYRLISHLSCFGKVFESIICKRIENAALRCGAISRSQLGGIQQNSVIDALIVITTPMSLALRRPLKGRKAKTRPKPTLATHDIEGAFNNTNPKVLEQIMEQRKMPTYIIQWVKEFTTDRLLSFGFDGISEIPKPFTGALP